LLGRDDEIFFSQEEEEEEEEYPCLSATFQCGVQSEDRFISPIFFLQLLIAVALDRRPA
jgi:hypothetical protein